MSEEIAEFVIGLTADLIDALEPPELRRAQVPQDVHVAGRRLVARLLPRRVQVHAWEVIMSRLPTDGTALSDEERRDLESAVDLTTRLGLLLIQGKTLDAQRLWAEFVDRFQLEPAAEIVADLLCDTTFLPIDVFTRCMHTWAAAAFGCKRVPEIMQSRSPQKKKRRRFTRRPGLF